MVLIYDKIYYNNIILYNINSKLFTLLQIKSEASNTNSQISK